MFSPKQIPADAHFHVKTEVYFVNCDKAVFIFHDAFFVCATISALFLNEWTLANAFESFLYRVHVLKL